MNDLKKIRCWEIGIILTLVITYMIRRLFQVAGRFDQMVADARSDYDLPWKVIVNDLSGYSHELNTIFPIIAGTSLVLGAWLIFHCLAWPAFQKKGAENSFFIYLILTACLIVTGIGVFHYFREYVEFTYRWTDDNHAELQVDGFKLITFFRKKTLIIDSLGIIILIGFYELLSQAFYFVYTRVSRKQEPAMTPEPGALFNIVYLFPLPLLLFLTWFAVSGNLPETLLYHRDEMNLVFFCGTVLLVYVLQALLYDHCFLLRWTRDSAKIITGLIAFAIVLMIGCMTLSWLSAWFRYLDENLLVLVPLCCTVAAGFAWLRKNTGTERSSLQQKVSVTSAELANLRSQINPHFLFNALNSLYTAALKEAADKTADGIQKLGDMMRFMLHENNRERIALNKEIEYLENYIHIQRIRIDESQGIDIRVKIEQPHKEIFIAPMMLIPFVENAFKHGISLVHPSWIYITLSFDETRLYFKVHNSLQKQKESDPEEETSGIGLENVQRRLDLVYPDRHQLDIQRSDQDYFISLSLTFY